MRWFPCSKAVWNRNLVERWWSCRGKTLPNVSWDHMTWHENCHTTALLICFHLFSLSFFPVAFLVLVSSLNSLLILSVNWRDRDNLLMNARHAVHLKCDGWILHLYYTLVCVAERAALNFSWIVRLNVKTTSLPEFSSHPLLWIITVSASIFCIMLSPGVELLSDRKWNRGSPRWWNCRQRSGAARVSFAAGIMGRQIHYP